MFIFIVIDHLYPGLISHRSICLVFLLSCSSHKADSIKLIHCDPAQTEETVGSVIICVTASKEETPSQSVLNTHNTDPELETCLLSLLVERRKDNGWEERNISVCHDDIILISSSQSSPDPPDLY